MRRLVAAILLLGTSFVTLAQGPATPPVTIRAGRLLDGRGGSRHHRAS